MHGGPGPPRGQKVNAGDGSVSCGEAAEHGADEEEKQGEGGEVGGRWLFLYGSSVEWHEEEKGRGVPGFGAAGDNSGDRRVQAA
jgi:hypothetical protein